MQYFASKFATVAWPPFEIIVAGLRQLCGDRGNKRPSHKSGIIPGTTNITCQQLDSTLKLGALKNLGYSSIAGLCDELFGGKGRKERPEFPHIDVIKAGLRQLYIGLGNKRPSHKSGVIPNAAITCEQMNNTLKDGVLKHLGYSGIVGLCDELFGAKERKERPEFPHIDVIKAGLRQLYEDRGGKRTSSKSGIIPNTAITCEQLDGALKAGSLKHLGYGGIAGLCDELFGRKERPEFPHIDVIKAGLRQLYEDRDGKRPSGGSGVIPNTTITCEQLKGALKAGSLKHLGYGGLAELCDELFGQKQNHYAQE